jgi:predicted Zn-dependent peptidase
MRRRTVFLVLLGALGSAAVASGTAAAAPPAAPPGYVETRLPNGLEVSILPRPMDPIVATQVWYHVGSANEDAGSRGLAHLFEHLMFGETARHGKRDYWEWHHRSGGDNNAYTSPDETVYVSEIPPEAHARVIDLEADRMTGLVLSRENLENEQRIVTEELRLAAENSPTQRVMVAAQKALLGKHPYAFDPTGSKEDVAAATTLAVVERAFGEIPRGGSTPPDVPPLLGWTFPEEVDLSEDLPPVEIAVIGFLFPPAGHEDGPALEVLVQLLARGEVNPFREDLVARRRKAIEAGAEVISLRR